MLARSERKSRTLFFFQSNIFFPCVFRPVRGDLPRVWLRMLWRIHFTIYWLFFKSYLLSRHHFHANSFKILFHALQQYVWRHWTVHLSLLPLKLRLQLSDGGWGGGRTWTEQIMFSAHIICLPGDHTKARENWGRDGKKIYDWPPILHPSAARPSSLRLSIWPPPQSGQRGPSATGNKWLGRMGQRLSASCCHTREEGDLEKHLRGIMMIITTLKWNFNRFIVMRARFDFYQRPPCGPLLHPEI